jgi:pilus assembly protein CpaB
MNRIALALALVLGVAGAGLIWLYTQRLEREIGGGRPVGVLVVRADVPLGVRITEAHLAIRTIPEAYVDRRNILATEVESVLGVRVATALDANDSLLWTDLASGAADRNLADLVKVGMRAVSVPIPSGSAFGGLLEPGDRVDVSVTTELPSSRERVSSIVAQNVLVLAIGDDTGDLGAGQSVREGRMQEVSLAVTIEQAQALALARDRGTVTLLLRNHEDTRVLVDVPALRGTDAVRRAPAVPAAASPAPSAADVEARLEAMIRAAAAEDDDERSRDR